MARSQKIIAMLGVLALAATSALAQVTFEARGVSRYQQDFDPNDGFDYAQLPGAYVVKFTIPHPSDMTLLSNSQNQGGSRTTYSGAWINSVVLESFGQIYTILSTPVPATLTLWDRANFVQGQYQGHDIFGISANIEGVGFGPDSLITVDFYALRNLHIAYDRLFIRGTPGPNTLDSDLFPTFTTEEERIGLYDGVIFNVDGHPPLMPASGRYYGFVSRCGAPLTNPCVADIDNGSGTGISDGGVSIEDLLYYLALFTEGTVAADLDNGRGDGTRDGAVSIEDLLYFLFFFGRGC